MSENKMGVMPIPKLLINMALPMMISMMVQALYNVVDSIFVSRICEEALTAVSMAFPMQNLMIGLGSGLAVGMNALLSRSLGEKNEKEANRFAMQGIFLCICGYLVFLVLGLLFAKRFFLIQDASDEIAVFGHDYLFIVTVFSFGLFMQMVFERLLQSTGRTFYSMITQGAGAIINIILDPILIFGYFGFPKMGIQGAAAATVIGQVVAAVLGFIFNVTINKEIHLELRGLKPSGKRILGILYIGIPSVLMIAIGSVMTFSVNKILITFSATAVAVFGVYFKLQSFVFMPVFGLNSGMVPIVAYNYGARRADRVKKTMRLAVLFAEGIMLVGFLIVQIFPEQLLGFFNASEDMVSIGIPTLRIISISFLFAGYCVICGSFFQALGNGIYSMLVSFFRQLVFLVPIAYLLSLTRKLNLVWLAWPAAELVSVLVSTYFLRRIFQKKLKGME